MDARDAPQRLIACFTAGNSGASGTTRRGPRPHQAAEVTSLNPGSAARTRGCPAARRGISTPAGRGRTRRPRRRGGCGRIPHAHQNDGALTRTHIDFQCPALHSQHPDRVLQPGSLARTIRTSAVIADFDLHLIGAPVRDHQHTPRRLADRMRQNVSHRLPQNARVGAHGKTGRHRMLQATATRDCERGGTPQQRRNLQRQVNRRDDEGGRRPLEPQRRNAARRGRSRRGRGRQMARCTQDGRHLVADRLDKTAE